MKQSKIVESLYNKYRLNERFYTDDVDIVDEERGDITVGEIITDSDSIGYIAKLRDPDSYSEAEKKQMLRDLNKELGPFPKEGEIKLAESFNRKPLKEGAQHTNHIKKILNSVADYLDSTYSNCSAITDGDNLKISENGFEETYNLSYDLVPVYTLSTPLDGIVFAYANENDLYPITDGQRLYGLNDNSTVSYIVNLVRDDIINSR